VTVYGLLSMFIDKIIFLTKLDTRFTNPTFLGLSVNFVCLAQQALIYYILILAQCTDIKIRVTFSSLFSKESSSVTRKITLNCHSIPQMITYNCSFPFSCKDRCSLSSVICITERLKTKKSLKKNDSALHHRNKNFMVPEREN